MWTSFWITHLMIESKEFKMNVFITGSCYCYTAEFDQNSIEPIKSNNDGCPIAFHRIGEKCYFYGYFKLNWFRAMEFCHSFGESVSLACIETQDENEHLKRWLIANGKITYHTHPNVNII